MLAVKIVFGILLSLAGIVLILIFFCVFGNIVCSIEQTEKSLKAEGKTKMKMWYVIYVRSGVVWEKAHT